MFVRAAAFLLVAAAAGPAMADARGEESLRRLIATLDAAEDWSASADLIRSEGADSLAEGIAVSREDPAISVRIERIRVRDLNQDAAGSGFRAAEIEVTGAGVKTEHTAYDIPAASARDMVMPSFDGFTVDVHRLMSTIAQFYTIAAQGQIGEMSVPVASATGREIPAGGTEPIETRVVYRDLRATGFRNGMIERQELGPFTITASTPEGATEATIETMFAEGINLAAIARIFDEAQYSDGRGDGEWAPVIASIGYSGFSGTGPDGVTFRLDDFSMTNIDGRQPEKPFTRDWDRLLDPSLSDDQKGDLALEAVRNMYSAWRLGNMQMSGLSFDAPAEAAKFSLGAITLSGLSTSGLDSFRIEAVSGEGPGGFGSLGAFEMTGLVFPEFKALMKFAALEEDASEREHADTVRAAFSALPKLAHFALRDITGGQAGQTPVRLGSFSFDMGGWNEFWAQSTDMRLENFAIPRALLELDPQATEVLNGLGYETLVFSLSFSDRWSPETGLDTGTWTMSMQDAANLEFTYTLTGVTPEWILAASAEAARAADTNAASMKMLEGLGLQSATLKVTDRSLLDRGFGFAAKKQGLTIEGPAYREQMRGALPFLLSAVVPVEITKLLTGPLQTFMGGGQTLVAEIAPPQPIPLMELMGAANLDPMQIPGVVGLTLRSEVAPPPP